MRLSAAQGATRARSRRLEAHDERRCRSPRDSDSDGSHPRVFYVATFEEAVYVVHAFEKRTSKTAPHDVELARDRYRALVKKRDDDAKKK
jgi:phage-related protein